MGAEAGESIPSLHLPLGTWVAQRLGYQELSEPQKGPTNPGPALPSQWGENRCGVLQSGKVVGVVLDLLAELAGQSSYSSAWSQGNSK